MVGMLEGMDLGGDGGDDGQGRVRVEPRIARLGSLRISADASQPSRGESPLAGRALVDIDGEQCRISGRFWRWFLIS